MKKIAFGCLAVVLAVAGSAFTAPKKSANLVYYFPLDESGLPEALSYVPPTTDTWECPGKLDPCSAGWGAYTVSGGLYEASGDMLSGSEEYEDD